MSTMQNVPLLVKCANAQKGFTMPGKKQPANEFFDAVSEMANKLFGQDEEEDRGRYIHQHMTRAGYRMVPSYVDDDSSDGKNDDDGFFPSRKTQRTQQRGNDRDRNQGSSGSGWFSS
jgi:hypothetical protein